MLFSIKQCLSGGFILACAVAAGTWNLRNDRVATLELTVSSYEKSQKWNLPETINRIEKASTHLDQKIVSILDNEKLKSELSEFKKKLEEKDKELLVINGKHASEISALKTDLKKSKMELERLNSVLAGLYNTVNNFSLDEGGSKKLLGLDLILSVTRASPTLMEADVVIQNKQNRMLIGNVYTIEHGEELCQLSLDSISSGRSASFTFVCKDKG
ncbi:hypothetical protein [Aeromonas veronii]|uniref:hypothetical protein n=1 Tax=Aeromonas veronii TaxID=654 RepID=UPI001F486E11|nr:hypothetical protein [Aeromonas veronii]MCF7744591.1 hypothetical protein [Aeromonas veronii]